MVLQLNAVQMQHLQKLSNNEQIISALALDQRGSLQQLMVQVSGHQPSHEQIANFKKLVAQELTPFASAILLDPEYGLPAAQARAASAGLLLAYEQTGYDTTTSARWPRLIENQSVGRMQQMGVDAVKLLLYYDVDAAAQVNDCKQAFVERIGAEAQAYNLPFFLELIAYDEHITPDQEAAYARIKPHKVIAMTAEFSKPQYQVTVLKVEVPVNQKYVAGYTDSTTQPVYQRAEALSYYKEQSEATDLPFIYLSAGVSNKLFIEELQFAKEAGAAFNGVLCGRATWQPGAQTFAAKGSVAGQKWLQTEGRANIQRINTALAATATPWTQKVTQL